ncbi:MAG: hypothetical protein V3U98_07095 [Acidobacteriota bacterium]
MHRTRICIAVAVLVCSPVLAEQPGSEEMAPNPRLERRNPAPDPSQYKEYRDSQNNRYRMDTNGNVFTSGVPIPRRQPASAENIIFYYNYAFDLRDKGYHQAGMDVFREILALPAKNELVATAQRLVREEYELQRSFRDNAEKFDEFLFVVRHVEDGRITYDNEKYRFRVRYPVNWTLEDEVRGRLEPFANLTLYPLALPARDGGSVSISIGFRAERVEDSMTPEQYREQWSAVLEETFESREEVTGFKHKRVTPGGRFVRDHFEVRISDQLFEGENAYLIERDFGYYLTFTATPDTFQVAHDIFERFLSEFEVLP